MAHMGPSPVTQPPWLQGHAGSILVAPQAELPFLSPHRQNQTTDKSPDELCPDEPLIFPSVHLSLMSGPPTDEAGDKQKVSPLQTRAEPL